MNMELMIDTLNMIAEKSQNSIEQIVRKNKSVSQKLKFVSLYLSEMKSQIYEWVCNILNSSKDTNKIIKRLSQLKISTDEELAKHRLHILLKKKLNKLKKQSFLHSMDSNNNFFDEQSKLHQLERSVLHIEKDLNIQQEEQQNLGVSSIIQKSRMINLDQSNVREQHNISTVSEYEVFRLNLNLTEKKVNQAQQNRVQSSPFYINRQGQNSEMLESYLNENCQIQVTKDLMKQNEEKNLQKPTDIGLVEKKQSQLSKDKKQGDPNKISNPPKIMKKKKKSIYSTMGSNTNISKDDLLGNILEECLQSQNK